MPGRKEIKQSGWMGILMPYIYSSGSCMQSYPQTISVHSAFVAFCYHHQNFEYCFVKTSINLK